MEYYNKPALPPPFCVLYPVVIGIKKIFVSLKHRHEKSTTEDLDVDDLVREKKRKTNTIGCR